MRSILFGVPLSAAVVLSSVALADEIFICEDGPNVVVQFSTPEKIAKLRAENPCVAKYFETSKQIAATSASSQREQTAAERLCGSKGCIAQGQSKTRGRITRVQGGGRTARTSQSISVTEYRR